MRYWCTIDQQPGTHGVGSQKQIIAIKQLLRDLRIEYVCFEAFNPRTLVRAAYDARRDIHLVGP
jgi:hypothetical protein